MPHPQRRLDVTARLGFRLLGLALCSPALGAQHGLLSHADEVPTGLFGASVGALADVDGDGASDALVGAPGADLGGLFQGRVRAVSGRTAIELYELAGTGGPTGLGWTVAGGPDLDGDGAGDFAATVQDFATSQHLRVRSGANGAPLFDVAFSAMGVPSGLAFAGDLDGDGLSEIAAVQGALPGFFDGRMELLSGSGGALLASFDGSALSKLGGAVAGAGDLDLDGVPDLLLSLQGAQGERALALSGATTAVLRSYVPVQATSVGQSLAALGDVSGDGVPEVLLGGAGQAALYSGASGLELLVVHDPSGWVFSSFGAAVQSAGDVDGDGRPDLAVGAPSAGGSGGPSFEGSPQAGMLAVYSSATGASLFESHGQDGREQLGASVAFAGDVDGDGAGELFVGGPGVPPALLPGQPGVLRVVSTAALSLRTEVHALSASGGGMQNFELDAGSAFGGAGYALLGSSSGTSPGTALGAQLLPLNVDAYTVAVLLGAGPLVGDQGLLDAQGRASASLVLPPGLPLGGLELHHAFLALSGSGATHTSNAAILSLLP